MYPEEIIAVMRAMFDALLRILKALGLTKSDEDKPEESTSENV